MRLLAEFVVHHGFAQQHSVGDELDVGVGTRAVVETDAVADLSAHSAPALLSDSLRDSDSCYTTRLRDSDHSVSTPERSKGDGLEQARFVEILSDLRGFTASRFSDDNRCGIVLDGMDDLLPVLVHGERASLLFELSNQGKQQIAHDLVPFFLVSDETTQRIAFRFRRTQHLSLAFSPSRLDCLPVTASNPLCTDSETDKEKAMNSGEYTTERLPGPAVIDR